jgi:hypothetical protein
VLVAYEFADSFEQQRANYYGFGTVMPTIVGDGLADIRPTALLTSCYNTLHALPSPLVITLKENATGDFTAHIEAEQAVLGATFVMVAVLDEYVPANGGGQSHLPYHCKAFMTAVTGDAFSIGAGESVDIRKTFAVNPAWNYWQMGVVCWVQKPGGVNPTAAPQITSTNEVLQAAYVHATSTGVPDPAAESRAVLSAPSPNPFAGTARLAFALPAAGHVSLDLYDVSGRHVVRLLDADLPQGAHEALWNGVDAEGRRCGAGIYLARMTYDGSDAGHRKIVKLK